MAQDFQIDDITARQYQNMWEKFNRGHIDVDEWKNYCMELGAMIMEKNADVFKRMKETD